MNDPKITANRIVPAEIKYELHLTDLNENDMAFLKQLCGKILGCREKSGRRITDQIYNEINNLGICENEKLVRMEYAHYPWAEDYPS